MVVGEISPNKEIIVVVSIRDDIGEFHAIQSVLNTGFGGYITLSASAIEMLGLTYLNNIDFVLAGDEPSRLRAYKGIVEWHGVLVTLIVLEVEGQTNIGMRLLYGSDLHAHLVNGGFATLATL